MIVGHDMPARKVYYSANGGLSWTELSENVLKHFWGYKSKSEIFLEVKTKSYSSELKHAQLPCGPKEVKIFDESLGEFEPRTFEVASKYMYVQKYVPKKGLYVYYKSNSSYQSGLNFFQRAHFPLDDEEEKRYEVVDASENEMMVVVQHGKSRYNLYVSDETGVKYSLSLENILSNQTNIWGKMTTLVDIHKVRSLNGTYLANVVIGNRYVRSVISYNKGGDWHLLSAPLMDHKGVATNCYPPECSLHVHIVLSRWLYYIPGVLSSRSAVGIIIAQGNLGRRLGESPLGVFMSNDGGLTWTKEFDSLYDFVIGDHGGILAAVSLSWRGVKEVWYSCTEGKTWRNVSLDSNVRVYGMVNEPGETTLIANLFGQYTLKRFQWLSVKLNFTTVLNNKCQANNYTYWSPNDERAGGQCLLGQHLVFERRKSGDCCFNGKEYEREINISSCACGEDDFECDFGFKHHELDATCIPTSSYNPIPESCPEGRTYQHSLGYRKVAGDRCVGGVEEKLKPETRFCPISVAKDLTIKCEATANAVAVGKSVPCNLTQKQGSTKTTRYTWNFGDGSQGLNVTGLSKAKRVSHVFQQHGDFVVTVAATNKAGMSAVTVGVTALDPITSVEIEPPHAVVIGEEAWFNITLHANSDQYSPQFGFVHFMWSFEKNITRPTLTSDYEVSHAFTTPGVFEVSVQAFSFIGVSKASVTITVHEELTTVRLSFDFVLDGMNENTKEWRSWLAKRLQALLLSLLKVDASRLEVAVLLGKPTKADVSITPAPTNDSKTSLEIVDLLKEKVAEGVAEIHLSRDITVRITHVEVLPNRGFGGDTVPSPVEKSGGTRLLIAVSIAASLVVILLVGTLVYFLRRYNRLQSRYTHLRLYSEGGELRDRDPLVGDDTETEDEQALHPQPGGTLRYIPLPTSTEAEPDSDEELIDNLQPGTLVVMPRGQDGQVHGENT